ncbi:MAG: hypothetical protein ABJO67_13460 [Pseudoruegeria sp.]
MADQLNGIKGRFLLSLNDTEGVREVFAGFWFNEVTATYSIAKGGAGRGKRPELLISNFEILTGAN